MKLKIVLVPFPFDDLSGVKVRPAICLTDKIGKYEHLVIAFITSQANTATEPSDLVLKITDPNFSLTGLKLDSAIRLDRLVTIPYRIVLRNLGVLPNGYHAVLEQKTRDLFGL